MDISTAPIGGTKLDWGFWFFTAIIALIVRMFVADLANMRNKRFVEYVTYAYNVVESLKATAPSALDKTALALDALRKLLAADGKTLKDSDVERAKVIWEAMHGQAKVEKSIAVGGVGSVSELAEGKQLDWDKTADDIAKRVIEKLKAEKQ